MARTKNLPFGMDEEDEYHTIVLRYRLRDKCALSLSRMARAVNLVWNYCNEAQRHAFETRWAWRDKWLSGFHLCYQTAGAGGGLGLHSHTVQETCKQYAVSRQSQKKRWLRFRGRKSLGWVPFDGTCVTLDGANVRFMGETYEPMHLREGIFHPASGFSGSFNQDRRGHWYINVRVDVKRDSVAPLGQIGIDLGLDELAGCSDGAEVKAPRFYRGSEARLAKAQKARHKPKKVRRIHAKLANRRKDFLHKLSHKITKDNGIVVVGNVSPSKLARTKMAKSVLDAGWSDFRHMLAYKAIMHGGRFVEVNEPFTSQACSFCGCRSGPKGVKGLGIREWTCSDCGAVHRRDVNSGKNILARGLASLAVGACHR